MSFFDSHLSPGRQYKRFPAPGSTLDLDFVNNRGCIAGVVGGALDRATVTRSTTATYFDASGNIQTAAINTARFGYDITSGRMLGLMSEPTRSNLLLNSLINKTSLSTQSVTVTAQSYALSFYGNGYITLSGAAAATLTGTSNTVKSVLIFTPSAGSLTATVSGNVFWAQLEAGINSTSFIPTDGTAKSRSGDSILFTGSAFSDWFNPVAGTFICEAYIPHNVTNSYIFSASNGSTTNAISGNIAFSNGSGGVFLMVSGGVTQGQSPPQITSSEGIYRIAGSYSANAFAGARGGVLGVGLSPSSLTVPTVDRLYVGAWGSGSTQMNGYIRRLTYTPRLLQNPEISGVSR